MLSQTKRNHTIDFIKGNCIVFVIITHYNFSDKIRLIYLFPFWIDMAVPIFMLLSGYVHMASFRRRRITRLKDAYNFHMIKSLTRFTVPYLIFFTIEFSLTQFPNIFAKVNTKLFSLGFRAFLAGGTGPGSYYYPLMIQFIIFFPLVFILIENCDSLGLLWGGVINLSYEILQGAYGINEGCYRLLIFRYTFLIFFGAFLCKNKGRKMRTGWGIASVIIGTFYILAIQYMGYESHIILYWQGTSVFASLFVIPILSLIIKKADLRCRLIELFGKASFHICLTQIIFYTFFAPYIYSIYDSKMLQFMICLSICLFTGCLFWMIEQKLMKWIISKEEHIFCRLMQMHPSEWLDIWLFK